MSTTITAGNATNNGASIASDTAGTIEIKTGSTPTTAITVDTSQNVGIGTTPSVALDISSTANSNSGQLRIASNGSNGTRMGFISTSTNGKTYQIGSNFITGTGEFGIYDATAGATRMIIDSSGNLLIKATTATQAITTGGWYLGIYAGGASALVGHNSSAVNGDSFISFWVNGNVAGNITQTGTTTVAYGTSSDYRLKENIAPMTGALAKVQQLKPVTYTWKTDGADGQGFIAHELQEVCPDAVAGEKDAVNEDGSIKPQSIDTSFLVATLTAAIQELNAKVDAQAAEIAALKGVA